MGCFHPNYLELDIAHPIKENGKGRYNFRGRYLGGLDDVIVDGTGNIILVGCKHCVGCKLTYARSWADRMLLELDHSKVACFITLTYNDDNLKYGVNPATGECSPTLVLRDVQLFMKNLRKHFKDKKIRVFYSGEYGDLHGRPHYHAILFGLDMSTDFPDFEYRGSNELGQPYFSSALLQSIWKCGYVGISDVSYKTFGYVARYCMKKVYKNNGAKERYDDKGRIPEFSHMSNRPGIGGYFLKEHGFEHCEFAMYDGQESKKVIIPSKLFEIERLNYPDLYDKIKEQRKEVSLDSIRAVMHSTDDDYITYLAKSEQRTLDKIRVLKRGDL